MLCVSSRKTPLPRTVTLRLKIAQKPYIVKSLAPKALIYESLEPKGKPEPYPLIALNQPASLTPAGMPVLTLPCNTPLSF